MRHILFFVSVISFLVFSGCKETNEEDIYKIDGGLYGYELALKFVNHEGINLLENIECTPGTLVDFPYEYTHMRWLENRKSNEGENLPNGVRSDGEQNYLRLWTGAYPWPGFYSPIIEEFTCQYLFADTLPHVIVSVWNKGQKNRTECTKLTIDGKDYPVAYDEKFGSYVATVVVNGGNDNPTLNVN